MKKISQLFAIALIGLFITSCCSSSTVESITIWVNGTQVDCEGVTPMKCLQIQEAEVIDDNNWQLFYTGIEGFEYEEGFIYQLKVTKEEFDPKKVAADASNIKYTLVEVISKEEIPLSLAGEWKLVSLNSQTLTLDSIQKAPQVIFDVDENRIAGFGGCNRISMSFELIEKSKIKISQGIATRMACPEPNVEHEFLMTIEKARLYILGETNLVFYDQEGAELLNFIRL